MRSAILLLAGVAFAEDDWYTNGLVARELAAEVGAEFRMLSNHSMNSTNSSSGNMTTTSSGNSTTTTSGNSTTTTSGNSTTTSGNSTTTTGGDSGNSTQSSGNGTSSSGNSTSTGASDGNNTSESGNTGTTTDPTPAYVASVSGAAAMTATVAATCDTTAEMASTACAGVRGAIELGMCKAMVAGLTGANADAVHCDGASKNFDVVITIARRRRGRQLQTAVNMNAAYTIVVENADQSAATTLGNNLVTAVDTVGSGTGFVAAMQTSIATEVAAAVTAGSISANDVAVASIDSFVAPTVAMSGGPTQYSGPQSVEAFAGRVFAMASALAVALIW